MSRMARIVIPKIPHHITQRGNNRQDVFFVDDDRTTYLSILREQSSQYGMLIDGYCLMTNHIHIIATPLKKDSFARAMGRTNLLYAQYINDMHGRGGHLWQNRFFSCPMDTDYFFRSLCYIEQNPVRAGMVRRAWKYRFSSAGFHIGQEDEFGLMDRTRWQKQSSGLNWKEILLQRQDRLDINKVRIYCRTGRPLGSDRFISKLEVMIGHRLRALPVGRPYKRKENKK
jgi:putative transposase